MVKGITPRVDNEEVLLKVFDELLLFSQVSSSSRYIDVKNTVVPHVLIDYDEIITLSYPIQLTIHIQTTSGGGLSEFAFNLNWLDANSMWMQLMRINLHSMRIIFVASTDF